MSRIRPLRRARPPGNPQDIGNEKAEGWILALPSHLGVGKSGFTGVLDTYKQQLGFHPHIHYIVPGAGLGKDGHLLEVKNAPILISA